MYNLSYMSYHIWPGLSCITYNLWTIMYSISWCVTSCMTYMYYHVRPIIYGLPCTSYHVRPLTRSIINLPALRIDWSRQATGPNIELHWHAFPAGVLKPSHRRFDHRRRVDQITGAFRIKIYVSVPAMLVVVYGGNVYWHMAWRICVLFEKIHLNL